MDAIANDENFEKSEKIIETFDSIEELKYRQEYFSDHSIVNILDDINEREMNDPRVKAMFKPSSHSNFSIFVFSQDCYEIQKKNYED